MQFKFTTVSFRVKKKVVFFILCGNKDYYYYYYVGQRLDLSPLGFSFKISDEYFRPFHVESPREYIVVQGKLYF